MPQFDLDGDGFISLEEYNKQTFDFVEDPELNQELSEEEIEHVKLSNKRDIRRFIDADLDHDGQLNDTEFGSFLHPHLHVHMEKVLAMETLEHIDQDGDGRIDENEFIDHIVASSQTVDSEWVEGERKNFKENMDKDGDGTLDQDEILHWIRPDGNTPVDFEVQHLVQRVDGDRDGRLSRQEVLDNYHHFFRSQATEWGKNLLRHDEL